MCGLTALVPRHIQSQSGIRMSKTATGLFCISDLCKSGAQQETASSAIFPPCCKDVAPILVDLCHNVNIDHEYFATNVVYLTFTFVFTETPGGD